MKPLSPRARAASIWLSLAAACLLLPYLSLRILLAPLPGEWAVPLRFGPLSLEAGATTLIRLATAPWLAPLLDGYTLDSQAGPVQLSWQDSSRTLTARCAPCALKLPYQDDEPIALDEVLLTLQRQGEQLSGALSSGKLRATWRSALEKDGLRLRLKLPLTPIADVYALLGASIPELAKARIEGRFGLNATLNLPESEFSLDPEIEGFQVSGLGTETLASSASGCSKTASRLTPASWLSHAVVAAEEQRPDEYHGDVLTELDTALPADLDTSPQPPTRRKGSTLAQQLAGMLITGPAHSPVHKLRELLYAVEMERTLGKPLILQIYLNRARWGRGICGAEAASRRYFNVRADLLTPLQAAWLAAMLHNPELEVERWRRTDRINIARTQWVLQGMQALPPNQRLQLKKQLRKLKWKAPRS
jgi:monofunctional biosynthetic peptidoglycan transglycosylase